MYKIWNKLISFDMEKKKKNLKQVIIYEEKDEFGGPKNEHLCFKRGTPTMLGPDHQKLTNHGDNLSILYGDT